MYAKQHCNSHFAAHLIASEERLQSWRESARTAWLIRESEAHFGTESESRFATARRGIGVALIRAGERLRGAPAVAAKTSALSANG